MHVQEKSCKSPKDQQLHQKDNSAQVFFCEYSKHFREGFLTLAAAFELSFSIKK